MDHGEKVVHAAGIGQRSINSTQLKASSPLTSTAGGGAEPNGRGLKEAAKSRGEDICKRNSSSSTNAKRSPRFKTKRTPVLCRRAGGDDALREELHNDQNIEYRKANYRWETKYIVVKWADSLLL